MTESVIDEVPTTPQQIATALVSKWEQQLGWDLLGAQPAIRHMALTQDVRDRMRDDIVLLINATIQQHQGP